MLFICHGAGLYTHYATCRFVVKFSGFYFGTSSMLLVCVSGSWWAMIWCVKALFVPEAEPEGALLFFGGFFHSGQPMTTGESSEPMGPAAAPVA